MPLLAYIQPQWIDRNLVKIKKTPSKTVVKSDSDPYLALLDYRVSPIKHELSPTDIG